MEKRHYSSGYNVNWKNDKNASRTASNEVQTKTENSVELNTAVSEKSVATNSNESDLLLDEPSIQTSQRENEVFASSNSEVIIPLSKESVRAYASTNKGVSPSITSKVPDRKANVKEYSKNKKDSTSPKKTNGGNRSWIIALVLCFFLGGLGIHRFYLGYTGLGVLMFFTGGLFGVLWIIDFIRILMKSLKPKGGDYN
jgi:thiol:disulfide interchange protein